MVVTEISVFPWLVSLDFRVCSNKIEVGSSLFCFLWEFVISRVVLIALRSFFACNLVSVDISAIFN